ncbi:uncharacterized protein LOC115626344 [Scaptodrosophila lebanonensis]|uniref:SUZ RNA-binding domain-containing n=1 Tax=Drosophila lebanonensis TaxID=7225 RepID=A0A6J2TR10_DROLE|nr:uncharacterized protein LOC115626344 [Scaptodrosophila lebanonensis]
MSNGDDVLDNWEEIDEEGLCMKLQTKLQTTTTYDTTTSTTVQIFSKPAADTLETACHTSATKMKVLQRPQSLQESSTSAASKQITIAKKPSPPVGSDDTNTGTSVVMVLHKSASEYDAGNYVNPISNQTVKILRRPAQAEERRDPNGIRPRQPIKTLQQREQEYAEARLRILGAAKNPEDDKPATPAIAVTSSATLASAPPAPVVSNATNNNNTRHIAATLPTSMHRSNSAPKMTLSPQCYNNYNNYFQPPPLNYFYQQAGPPPPSLQLQQQQPHYNQRMPAYGTAPGVPPQIPQPSNAQQSWSPVVGGSVSAALLRQQQQQQAVPHHHHQQQQQHPYNDNILRLPRGPCPNGTIGFQMRR